ncbi:NAD-dependent epimerase/dehydratase family protein [Paenibacillus sp. GSMTC-2017]|uniref:NAD-dependent epimerase/dehydratase family protein n=1 Tax=Paenibacillus sp. GSMTC-2017 TaxID=2794350 RepID=UPI0018D638B3|nr:NAD-dependent epimerase/dehydratase family protein [Paenibacillus sp. GSMTC-2017]MBH5319634.1 NAD-dependent epimerase/dehydratase family protein [Paenibacillus sp. GSMTC-2017]
MSKILVLGGTRFFGKRLVEGLVQNGHDVTIVTRGNMADSFGHSVKRLQVDRTDSTALEQALGSTSFDIVYDNICYTPQVAEDALKLFAGRTGRYILTSSGSVYNFGEQRLSEKDFDPYVYPVPDSYEQNIDYAEGKRLVEAVFLQKASFPVAAVRFPIVLGHDDYTRRLHFHVERVQQELPIGIPNLDAKMTYIRADEAASFLAWIGQMDLEGPFNAASYGEVSLREILAIIEQETGKRGQVVNEVDETNGSPFGITKPFVVDNAKAVAAGASFHQLRDWLPELISEIADPS